MQTPAALPGLKDDAWTAFILMFHDGDWETSLLQQALSGPAFYIGAVGSPRTHKTRCEALVDAGSASHDIDRIHGPVGLVPSMRDASMLAISTLAEIVDAFHKAKREPRSQIGYLLLAAGASSRFERGDKLLASLDGQPVLMHASRKAVRSNGPRLAVIGPDQGKRRDILEKNGWAIWVNDKAETGQASSLKAGLTRLAEEASLDQVMILLGDMPNVPTAHLFALEKALTPQTQAVMTEVDGVLMPPALFRREAFETLQTVSGDRGARSVFERLENTATVSLAAEHAIDIDQVSDLAEAERLENA